VRHRLAAVVVDHHHFAAQLGQFGRSPLGWPCQSGALFAAPHGFQPAGLVFPAALAQFSVHGRPCTVCLLPVRPQAIHAVPPHEHSQCLSTTLDSSRSMSGALLRTCCDSRTTGTHTRGTASRPRSAFRSDWLWPPYTRASAAQQFAQLDPPRPGCLRCVSCSSCPFCPRVAVKLAVRYACPSCRQ